MTRILVVTNTPPCPTINGGHQRSNLILRALDRCGQVDLVLLRRNVSVFPPPFLEEVRRAYERVDFVERRPLGSYWPWSLLRPLRPIIVDIMATRFGGIERNFVPDPLISKWLAERVRTRHYDLIVGRYLQPTVLAGALEYAPVILDVDDLDTDRCRTELAMPGAPALRRWVLKRRLRQLEQLEPGLLRRPAHLWVCSETDRKIVGESRATVLPNIPYTPPDMPRREPLAPEPKSQRVLIVGSLAFPVNARGIDRFLARVWPAVRRQHPGATFRIVGVGLTKKQKTRWSRIEGVEPIGFAEDLTDEYARAAFTVAPLFEGGGTKIKVLESLAFGRTCVLARHALRGFEHVLKHRESLWSGEDDGDILEGCVELLKNPSLRNDMAQRGHNLVMEHFTFERFAETISRTVESVLRRAPNGVQKIQGHGRTSSVLDE